MNQDAIDARLALIVEQALQPSALDERGAGTPECMAELLGHRDPISGAAGSPAVRAAALNVAALSSGAYWEGEADENRFRQALVALRDELDTQREEAEAASQLACDPELVQEFLVEARAHLAEVETAICCLRRNRKTQRRSTPSSARSTQLRACRDSSEPQLSMNWPMRLRICLTWRGRGNCCFRRKSLS